MRKKRRREIPAPPLGKKNKKKLQISVVPTDVAELVEGLHALGDGIQLGGQPGLILLQDDVLGRGELICRIDDVLDGHDALADLGEGSGGSALGSLTSLLHFGVLGVIAVAVDAQNLKGFISRSSGVMPFRLMGTRESQAKSF